MIHDINVLCLECFVINLYLHVNVPTLESQTQHTHTSYERQCMVFATTKTHSQTTTQSHSTQLLKQQQTNRKLIHNQFINTITHTTQIGPKRDLYITLHSQQLWSKGY